MSSRIEDLFAKIALHLGLVDERTLNGAKEKTEKSKKMRLGTVLIESGALTEDERKKILYLQRQLLEKGDSRWNENLFDRLFQAIAVKRGFVSQDSAKRIRGLRASLLKDGKNVRVDALMVEEKVIDENAQLEILGILESQLVSCGSCKRKYPRKLLKEGPITCGGCEAEVRIGKPSSKALPALDENSPDIVASEGEPDEAEEEYVSPEDSDAVMLQLRAVELRAAKDSEEADSGKISQIADLSEEDESRIAQQDTDEFDAASVEKRLRAQKKRSRRNAFEADHTHHDGIPLVRKRGGVEQADLDKGGRSFGPFHLEKVIGKGAMGVVYLAKDTTLGRRVALKILPATLAVDKLMVERFKREATAASRLDHPSIVKIFGLYNENGAHGIAMEFVEGKTLKELMKKNLLQLERAVQVTLQASRAIHYAHCRGIVHRDIKPENIMVRESDGTTLVMDFGLARDIADGSLTKTGLLVGTPSYMAPEQAEGRSEVISDKCDQFALCATLYEITTKKRAFEGSDIRQVLSRVLFSDPVPPTEVKSDFPRDLETIILKGLAKNPAERYESMDALADDLHRFISGERISAHRPNIFERALKRLKKKRDRVVAVVSMLAALAMLIALLKVQFDLNDAAVVPKSNAQTTNPVEATPDENDGGGWRSSSRRQRRDAAHTIIAENVSVLSSTRDQEQLKLLERLFGQAISIDPTYAEAYFYRGRARQRLAKFAEALADFEKSYEEDAASAIAHYYAAMVAFSEFEYEPAKARIEKEFLAIREIDPNSHFALIGEAFTRMFQKDYAAVVESCDKAIQRSPNFADAYYFRAGARSYFLASKKGMGIISVQRDQTDKIEALGDLDRCLDLDHTNPEATLLKGILLDQLGDSREASDFFDVAVDLSPNSARARFWRAGHLLKARNYEQAAKDYDLAIEYSGGHSAAYAGRGIYKFNRRMFQESATDFTLAIENAESPREGEAAPQDHTFLYFCRGLAHSCADDPTSARGDMESWISYNPELTTVVGVLSEMNSNPMLRGRLVDVVSDRERIFELSPDRKALMIYFSVNTDSDPLFQRTFENFGTFEEVTWEHVEFMDTVLEISRENGPERQKMDNLLAQTPAGELGAITLLAIASEYLKNMDNETTLLASKMPLRTHRQYYQRACAHYRSGRYDAALADLEAADRMNPDSSRIQYALATIHSLLGNESAALEALEKSIANGFTNTNFTRMDSDFANLRANPRFSELVGP
ncbi:MAG: protein kinase [Planctomycetes bacterium]|nr:protein kinase [Planctomycetota bacterium]